MKRKCIRQHKLDNDEMPFDKAKMLDYVTDYYQILCNSNDTCSNCNLFDLQAKT